MNPYREAAERPREPMARRIGRWLCGRGHHSVVIIMLLTGGEGPDEAAQFVRCRRCDATGWKYCDGTYSW